MKPSRPPPPTRALDRALARLAARAGRARMDPQLPARVEATIRLHPQRPVALPTAGVLLLALALALGAWLVDGTGDRPPADQAGAVPAPASSPPPPAKPAEDPDTP